MCKRFEDDGFPQKRIVSEEYSKHISTHTHIQNTSRSFRRHHTRLGEMRAFTVYHARIPPSNASTLRRHAHSREPPQTSYIRELLSRQPPISEFGGHVESSRPAPDGSAHTLPYEHHMLKQATVGGGGLPQNAQNVPRVSQTTGQQQVDTCFVGLCVCVCVCVISVLIDV